MYLLVWANCTFRTWRTVSFDSDNLYGRSVSGYQRRVVDHQLDELLPVLPAISIEGAKGVGKTSTALQRSASVFRLDDPEHLELLTADPNRILQAPEPVLIDEWQRHPPVWDLVKRAVDEDNRPGRFLLTGSASPRTPSTHSGAGRIVTLRMRPMTLAERWPPTGQAGVSLSALLSGERVDISGSTDMALGDYVAEIVTGGFPGMRSASPTAQRSLIDGYVDRIVDSEIREAGYTVRNPAGLRRWMRAYAAATSTDASLESIRDAATSNEGDKPSRSATRPYTDVLERIWIIDPLPAWLPSRNELRRLVKSARHHMADPAFAVALRGLSAEALVDPDVPHQPSERRGLLAGPLFESLMALNLRVYAQAAESRVHHFRTRAGQREIDFIIERRDGKVLALEVKLTRTPDATDGKHLRWLHQELGDDLLDMVIVTTGGHAYRRDDGIAVIPASLLGP